MTCDEIRARLAALDIELPESDLVPLVAVVAEIERAGMLVRGGLEMTDEMSLIFPVDRLAS